MKESLPDWLAGAGAFEWPEDLIEQTAAEMDRGIELAAGWTWSAALDRMVRVKRTA